MNTPVYKIVGRRNVLPEDDFVLVRGVYDSEKPETNISQAHKKCVRSAHWRTNSYCIIQEDDNIPTHPDSMEYFQSLIPKLPGNWDIFLGGFYHHEGLKQVKDNIYSIEQFSGLHCYAVNKKFYNRFLEADENYHLDFWLWRMSGAKIYTCYPIAFIQQPGYSENKKEVVDYSYMIKDTPKYDGTPS